MFEDSNHFSRVSNSLEKDQQQLQQMKFLIQHLWPMAISEQVVTLLDISYILIYGVCLCVCHMIKLKSLQMVLSAELE